MTTLVRVIALASVAVHIAVLIFTHIYSTQRQLRASWLKATISLSLLASATLLLPESSTIERKLGPHIGLIVLLVTMLFAFGRLVINDMAVGHQQRKLLRIWLGLSGAWIAGLLMSLALDDTFIAGQSGWVAQLFSSPDVSALTTLAGLFITGLFLLAVSLYMSYIARLPETANRALFWTGETTIVLMGMVVLGSGTGLLVVLGMLLLIIGMVGAVYAKQTHRVFDMRYVSLLALRTLAFVLVVGAMIFVSLYLVATSDLEPDPEGIALMAALGLLIAAFYVPLRQSIEALIQRLRLRNEPDPTQATREYSRLVFEATDLESLIYAAANALSHIMRVRSSCLIFVNNTAKVKDSVELLVRQPGNANDRLTGYLAFESPIYQTLAVEQEPCSQFDIEFAPQYQELPTQEREFFRSLQMSAYAPIIMGNTLIGLLACGPKANDGAFYSRDLELLSTLAQQTGIALRNARDMDDTRHLYKSMQSLNRTLKETNEQLNYLDSVKTDFVTIASHELRTPLAQVRGYTDIVDTLNERGMLDPERITGLVANLRKATERIEELIAAMLDVSQIDVDAMDLHLHQISIETIIQLAIEPLTDAINQRNLSVSTRDLSRLPTIQADLQRLVQAFRNIVVNAIKFTPDGGKIEIIGSLHEDGDYILVKIVDTGVGIKPQNLTLIFDKFFRGYDPSRHSTGTYKFMGAGPGLGLTIAKGVIEGHGGKVWAESPGHDMETFPGCTFHVLLPISAPEKARRVLPFTGDTASLDAARAPMEKSASIEQIGSRDHQRRDRNQ